MPQKNEDTWHYDKWNKGWQSTITGMFIKDTEIANGVRLPFDLGVILKKRNTPQQTMVEKVLEAQFAPRRYTWKYDNVIKEWYCKETSERVSDTQIANVGCYEDIGHIPKSFHVQLRMLMAKRQMNGCKHVNKIEITTFMDPKRHYTCPDCGWSTPRLPKPKEIPALDLPALDDIRIWVAEQEGVVASWKAEAKVNAAESKRILEETDALIKEVFE